MRRFGGILLTTGLLLAIGCGGRKDGSVRIDPALAPLVPSDTTVLAGVRMEALRNTPVYRKYAAEQKLPQLDEFVKRTGLDPRQDIWELLWAFNGKDYVAMVRGKFGPTGLEPELEKAGAKRLPYKGYSLIGSDELAIVFMNASVALAAKPATLRSILDQRDNGGGRIPPALARQIESVPAQSQIWVAALGPFPAFTVPLAKGDKLALPAQIFATTASFTAFADLRTAVDVSATTVSVTEQDAKRLHDTARGVIGLGRLSTPDARPELLRFYDGIQVEQQQRSVRLHVQVSLDLFEKLLHSLPSRTRAPVR